MVIWAKLALLRGVYGKILPEPKGSGNIVAVYTEWSPDMEMIPFLTMIIKPVRSSGAHRVPE